jgi:hypothetical protein
VTAFPEINGELHKNEDATKPPVISMKVYLKIELRPFLRLQLLEDSTVKKRSSYKVISPNPYPYLLP